MCFGPRLGIDLVLRKKAAYLGLNQRDVMSNVVAAFNSSIQFNKKNFWIDPVSHNQYFVGVQYPEGDIKDIDTLLDVSAAVARHRKRSNQIAYDEIVIEKHASVFSASDCGGQAVLERCEPDVSIGASGRSGKFRVDV